MRDWVKFTIGLVFSILCRRAAGKKQECETMEYRINHVHIRAVDPRPSCHSKRRISMPECKGPGYDPATQSDTLSPIMMALA